MTANRKPLEVEFAKPEGRLLMVIPAIAGAADGKLLIDEHFANNLRSYLRAFEHVTIACPSLLLPQANLVELGTLQGGERAVVHLLPEPYREDRYFRHRRWVLDLFAREIARADYITVSPHSAFDWSTVAGLMALKLGREYVMEADWDLQSVWRENIRAMPNGLRKVRQLLWLTAHTKPYHKLLRGSKLAMLQGATVFDAYHQVAPNPHQVLNVQITDADRIDLRALEAKQRRVLTGEPLRIVYAGRMISMKGPEDWLKVLAHLKAKRIPFKATWLGDGELRPTIECQVKSLNLEEDIQLAGSVSRGEVQSAVKESDLFLFCHKTQESPRCLLEALALGTPLVGYDSLYVRDLIASNGGGELVQVGQHSALLQIVEALSRDREKLAEMMAGAYQSATFFDRDRAIEERIALIKTHLSPREVRWN